MIDAGRAADRRSASARPRGADPAAGDGTWHVVLPGETAWRIAQVYGVELAELARTNAIEDPSRLRSGQKIWIPRATAIHDLSDWDPKTADTSPAATETPHSPNATDDLAFIWPLSGARVLSPFGAPRGDRSHRGIDLRGPAGEQVVAARAGRVVFSGRSRGYGETIVVDHGDGFRSLYAHAARRLVDLGEEVRRGQALASVGSSGNASADHCHFEIRRDNVPVDPLAYLPDSGN